MKSRFLQQWNAFFFVGVDPRVYGYLRFAIGGILAVYALVLAPNWLLWFSEDGVLSLEASRQNIDPDVWSVLFWLPGTPVILSNLMIPLGDFSAWTFRQNIFGCIRY